MSPTGNDITELCLAEYLFFIFYAITIIYLFVLSCLFNKVGSLQSLSLLLLTK